jgi:hypothetical protein
LPLFSARADEKTASYLLDAWFARQRDQLDHAPAVLAPKDAGAAIKALYEDKQKVLRTDMAKVIGQAKATQRFDIFRQKELDVLTIAKFAPNKAQAGEFSYSRSGWKMPWFRAAASPRLEPEPLTVTSLRSNRRREAATS